MMRWLCVLGLLLTCGCGATHPTPFTATDMAKEGTGAALAHYLGQPGATAATCDRKAKGPHFEGSTRDDFDQLTRALLDGDVPAALWQRCAMLMLESSTPAQSATLLDAMAGASRTLLRRGAIEDDAGEQAKFEALHHSLMLRPRGVVPHPEVVEADLGELREALAEHRLGPVASRYGQDLLVTIDLDRGRWQGAPLTAAVLDALAARKDEPALRRIARRVPDDTLEREARRRLIRLHIAASRSPHVRDHAEEIEAAVLASGRNPIDLERQQPTSAWLDEKRAKVRGILVRQDVRKQTATLLAYEGQEPGAAGLRALDLRGALFVRVEGLDEPVTLCAPPVALDVTPCLLPAEVHPSVPIVYLDDEGLLHFVERIASRDALRLVYNTPNLPLPFAIHGRKLLTIEWPIVFERPEPLVFWGTHEARGPDLRVTLERRYSTRLLFEVEALGERLVGVVEPADFSSFEIASRGAAGTAGTPGSDGAPGTSGSAGMSASCPSMPGGNGGPGGPGGNGTSGGPGGPGGDGGDVLVRISCVTGGCGAFASAVRNVVRSEGGAGGQGGRGGSGGSGGPGGMGGSGTSCTVNGQSTYLSGGAQGMQGPNGSPGAVGSNGASGSPGKVQIQVVE
jgi:hypothetical protein